MESKFSKGFAAFVLSAASAASVVSAQTVSVDLLRHPINEKARPLLIEAVHEIESGKHETAIQQLHLMLAKYPDSAPYVFNLLGVAYVKTDRCGSAVTSFEQAEQFLPHDPTTHYYLGLALLCAGDYDRATQEIQQALKLDPLKLDPKNARMQERLNQLLEHKRSGISSR
jgi:Flp pilus assembly protein TadD